eukprot:SAG11_NODE_1110_length_5824_cov_7.340087_1_plen_355_part_00
MSGSEADRRGRSEGEEKSVQAEVGLLAPRVGGLSRDRAPVAAGAADGAVRGTANAAGGAQIDAADAVGTNTVDTVTVDSKISRTVFDGPDHADRALRCTEGAGADDRARNRTWNEFVESPGQRASMCTDLAAANRKTQYRAPTVSGMCTVDTAADQNARGRTGFAERPQHDASICMMDAGGDDTESAECRAAGFLDVMSLEMSLEPFLDELTPGRGYQPTPFWNGARDGSVFKMDTQGLGYYADTAVRADGAESAGLVQSPTADVGTQSGAEPVAEEDDRWWARVVHGTARWWATRQLPAESQESARNVSVGPGHETRPDQLRRDFDPTKLPFVLPAPEQASRWSAKIPVYVHI